MRPAHERHFPQCFPQTQCVGLERLGNAAHATALAQHRAEARPPSRQAFEPEARETQAMGIGQFPQRLERRGPTREQAVQLRVGQKVHIPRVDHLGGISGKTEGAELAVTPQALVVERLALLHPERLEEQCANLTGSTFEGKLACLPQQPRVGGVAQVRSHAASDVRALANIQRELCRIADEVVDAGRLR